MRLTRRCVRILRFAGPSETMVAVRPLLLRRLPGLQAYEPVWRAMQAFTDARDAIIEADCATNA